MDALQAIASATQIVASMVGAVSALEAASRDLSEAPKRIRVLEEFVSDLENLVRHIRQKHAHKLHNPQFERQIESLSRLIERLHPNLMKARRVVAKSKTKRLAKVVWSSMVGDPLSKLIQSIRSDLDWWLELQRFSENIERVVVSTAENASFLFKVNVEQGYPVYKKCHHVRKLLEQEGSNRVVLIVGLSGIGKSCFARQVASDPPSKFIHGAVELSFGQWCSRAACNGSRMEYQKRLAKKICRFLMQIGFVKIVSNEMSGDLEDVCCMLQTALLGKSVLVILDDVWEQDIVDHFAKLYNNDCRYLVTTRNEAVYEITEAEKVEICRGDTEEISKEILLYHSMLNSEELPSVGDTLLESCGHHPLTVAVMGKALRKDTRGDKWEKAISNLSTYATCAPGPVSYVNEKDAENTLTIFRSFEFSLEAMPEHSQRLFVVLAAISWAEPVPESCLEALWSVLEQETVFPLVICKLVEGSLLIKMESHMLYHVHDMVSLFLDMKTNDAIHNLLKESSLDSTALIAPWLFIFGKECVKTIAEENIKLFLTGLQEKQVVITLETIGPVLMASKSISELEDSRKSFSRIVGPRVTELILAGSPAITVAAAKAITIIFSKEDYCNYVHSLEEASAIDKCAMLLESCNDLFTQITVSEVVAKLAEHGIAETIDKVLASVPINQLAELLAPEAEEWHESIFSILLSLIKAGKSKAVEMMISSGVDKKLVILLGNGSEVAQHHAIITLKTIYELGPLKNGCIRPGMLNLLPWNARLSLEKFILSDRNILSSPKPQPFEDLLSKILDDDNKQVMEAMQELIPIVEKAGEPRIRDMILQSHLIERLALLLKHGVAEPNQARAASAFVLMKLACAGGEPFIRKYLEFDIVLELVKMMQSNNEELQDLAYTALHQIVFASGGKLVVDRFLHTGTLERLARYLDSKSLKTREMSMLFLEDLAELSSKTCIERMFSLQVIERLVNVEKLGGQFSGAVVRFLKRLDMCKNVSPGERQVMKQQVLRKLKTAVKGHRLETTLIATMEAYLSEGSRGASSSKQKK